MISLYHAILDCYAKIVTLAYPSLPQLVWTSTPSSYLKGVIFYVYALYIIYEVLLYCLAYEYYLTKDSYPLETMRVVREFMDGFLTSLLGPPIDHGIDFVIKLEWVTKCIFISPYRINLLRLIL